MFSLLLFSLSLNHIWICITGTENRLTLFKLLKFSYYWLGETRINTLTVTEIVDSVFVHLRLGIV